MHQDRGTSDHPSHHLELRDEGRQLVIRGLTVADTAQYQCSARNPAGHDSQLYSLDVHGMMMLSDVLCDAFGMIYPIVVLCLGDPCVHKEFEETPQSRFWVSGPNGKRHRRYCVDKVEVLYDRVVVIVS